MSKKLLNLLLVIMMLAVFMPTTLAAPPAQEEGQDYIIVADDWLSKLAEKYLGNPLIYPIIVYYTNQKNAEDASYAKITNANLIEVGWKIYIPSATEAQAYLAAPTDTEVAEAVLPDLGPIKVGSIPIIAFAPFFVAVEKGYFAEQGLQVELENFSTGALMIAPLSTGELDVGGIGVATGLFNAIQQGLDLRVVSSVGSEPPGYNGVPLLVRKDLFDSGEITEPADLEGRKVAVNVERSVNEFLVSEVLAQADLTVDDVELVALPFPDIPVAFANKAVDAACLPFPLAGKALGEELAVVLIPGDKVTYWPQNGVLGFGKRFLDPANREAAVRFLVAYLKACRDVYQEGWTSDENAAIVNQYTNVPIPTIQKGASFYFEPNGRIYQPGVEKIQAYFVGRGYTDFAEMLPLDQVIDESFLEEALARLGEVEAEFEHD